MATAAARTVDITLPRGYSPRSYQARLLAAWDAGCKRGVWVVHRRGGKDRTCLQVVVREMIRRIGVYHYIFPELKQGRKVLWDGKGRDGKPFLDAFPPEMVEKKREDDMIIRLSNGSHFQIVGGDNIDANIGTNPVGAVYSEWSLMSPRAYELYRPIFRENQGWALFNYTPRGMNHGYTLYNMAKDNPDWFCDLLTVRDTRRDSEGEDGLPVLTEADIEAERREGMPEELIQSEFYCSFQAALVGAYFGTQMDAALREGRIRDIPIDPNRPVHTLWDIGVGDTNAIWFFQHDGVWYDFIDYYETNNVGLEHYVKFLQGKPYIYGQHVAPHDIRNREYTSSETRERFAQRHGLRFTVAPNAPIRDDIDIGRRIISKCRFDQTRCSIGIEALRSYRKKWSEDLKIYEDKPLHDWSSHGATSFMKLAYFKGGLQKSTGRTEMQFNPYRYEHEQRPRIVSEFNPYEG